VLRSLLYLSVAILVSACGGASEPGPPAGLVFSRADGSVIDIPGRTVAWCGPWNDMIPAQALQIAAIEGVEPAPGQEWFSYWRVWAIVADVRTGKPVTFPNEFVWNKPRRAEIFVGDFPTENEASSKQEGSSGHIVFRKATCELGGEVEFTIDAAIGSEFGDNEPILAAGTFRGVVGEPPARY
jgi:hypothetical protein